MAFISVTLTFFTDILFLGSNKVLVATSQLLLPFLEGSSSAPLAGELDQVRCVCVCGRGTIRKADGLRPKRSLESNRRIEGHVLRPERKFSLRCRQGGIDQAALSYHHKQ